LIDWIGIGKAFDNANVPSEDRMVYFIGKDGEEYILTATSPDAVFEEFKKLLEEDERWSTD